MRGGRKPGCEPGVVVGLLTLGEWYSEGGKLWQRVTCSCGWTGPKLRNRITAGHVRTCGSIWCRRKLREVSDATARGGERQSRSALKWAALQPGGRIGYLEFVCHDGDLCRMRCTLCGVEQSRPPRLWDSAVVTCGSLPCRVRARAATRAGTGHRGYRAPELGLCECERGTRIRINGGCAECERIDARRPSE